MRHTQKKYPKTKRKKNINISCHWQGLLVPDQFLVTL